MSHHLVGLRALCLVALMFMAACGRPPQPEIDAAIAAETRARTAEADRYAPEAMGQVQAARTALDDELARQGSAWLPSYARSRELATALQTQADNAVVAASTAKTKAEADAAAARRAAARRGSAVATVRTRARATEPVKVKEVLPDYPDIARSAGVDGTVTIAARVGTDGAITDARVVKSVPLLDKAALDAVKQWTYKPSLLNGKPVPADLVVNVQFVR
jgi:TonB family protein